MTGWRGGVRSVTNQAPVGTGVPEALRVHGGTDWRRGARTWTIESPMNTSCASRAAFAS